MPSNDTLPKTRSFKELFNAMDEKLEVYLSIPLENENGRNCQLESENKGNVYRYKMITSEIYDDNLGINPRKLGVSKANFQFLFGTESLEEFSSIKIGETHRTSDGSFNMDNSFIPPVLNIAASDQLMNYFREILSGLVSKSKALRDQRKQPKIDFTITEVEKLMMLNIVNTYIPLYNQFYNSRNIHPEALYNAFLLLAGQLITFTGDFSSDELEFIQYDHKNLTSIFSTIYHKLMVLLNIEKKLVRKDTSIPLKKQGDSLYISQLTDSTLANNLYLSVGCDFPENKVISDFPQNVKIAAYEEIFAVLQAGIQGVSIEHISRPPKGLAEGANLYYFRIIKEGRFWDKVSSKLSIAFFLTSDFINVDLKLIALSSD
jgi:type VI secretion system protein ImpJ